MRLKISYVNKTFLLSKAKGAINSHKEKKEEREKGRRRENRDVIEENTFYGCGIGK